MMTNDVQPHHRYRVTVLQDLAATDVDALARLLKRAPTEEPPAIPPAAQRLLERLQAAERDFGPQSSSGGDRYPLFSHFVVPKKVTPAGAVYEGVASHVVDGFFDLNLDDGEAIVFYQDDPGILIEAI